MSISSQLSLLSCSIAAEPRCTQRELNPHFRHGKPAGYRYIMGANVVSNCQRTNARESRESKVDCRRGSEPTAAPVVCISSLHFLISPALSRLGRDKHRVGLEPTLPHYGCGVLAAERPVRVKA